MLTDATLSWPLHVAWADIAARLVLTAMAGALLGFNRGASGHAAGLRTTILVGVAAAVAMIQANILLPTGGKAPDSFATLDLMRMPLGILTGVGFIGGGVILKHGSSVKGVTTAATLWIVTAIGLCFGGGQLGLGIAGTAIALLALKPLKVIERRIPRACRAELEIVAGDDVEPPDLNGIVRAFGCSARFVRQKRDEKGLVHAWYEVRWMQPEARPADYGFLRAIAATHPVQSFALRSESDD